MTSRWSPVPALAGLCLLLAPTAPRAQGAVQTATGDDLHVVVPGDTLWGIAQHYFGDPGGWPGLWSVNNDEITNPHYIYPGQIVRFSAGTVITPPSLGLSGGVTAVPYDETFQPVAKFWSSNRQCGIYVPFAELGDTERLAAPGFITDEMTPLGRVVGAQEGKGELAAGDLVYLKFDNLQDVHCGDVYSVYETQGTVDHPALQGSVLGTAYRVLGEIRITDVSDRMATAELLDSFYEVHRGAMVTDRVEVVADVKISTSDRNVGGFIVSRLGDGSPTISRGDVVFIDKGKTDGITSGDQFWVVRSGDEADERTLNSPDYPDYIVGRLVIFASDEYQSTAVVTDAGRELLVGDRITTYVERLDKGTDADGE